jgi:hypothetical protein
MKTNISKKNKRIAIVIIVLTVLALMLSLYTSRRGNTNMRVETKAELGEIFGFDFTDFIITEIYHKSLPGSATEISLFGIGTDEAISSSGFTEQRLENMSHVYINILEEAGLFEHDVSYFWGRTREIFDGFWYRSYHILLFPLVEPRADGSNIFMFTALDARVVIDVERVLAESQS